MNTTFYLVSGDKKHKNVVTHSGGLADLMIPYTEEPCTKDRKNSPFGAHTAEVLFSLFTANIIEANTQFVR